MVYFETTQVSALLPLLKNISLKKWTVCERSSLWLIAVMLPYVNTVGKKTHMIHDYDKSYDLQNLNHFRIFSFKLSL